MPERSAAGVLWLMFRDADTQTCLRFKTRIRTGRDIPSDIISVVLKMKPVA